MSEFAIRNLSVLNYANGFTSWHYKVTGAIDQVIALDYFDAAMDMIAPGDIIFATNETGAVTLHVGKDKAVASFASLAQP